MMTFMLLAILVAILAVAVPVRLILAQTYKKKGLWGINFSKPRCPKCEESLPRFRKPTTQHQAMWGGSTCNNCGCEIDKWGVEISPQNNASPQNQLSNADREIPFFDEDGKSPTERIFDSREK